MKKTKKMLFQNLAETKKEFIEVQFLYEANKDRIKLHLLNSDTGFKKKIRTRDIHRPGLALAGYTELFTYDRVQVFGNTEIRYLQHQSLADRLAAFERLFQFDIPCIIISNDNILDDEMLQIATDHGVCVFQCPLQTTFLTYFLSDFLDDQFARQATVHGSFVDVYGIGLLFVGRSGIGKSELALDLIERGHRLVADDVVIVTRKGDGILIGASNNITGHFMEIRGLGFIDVQAMFGIRGVRYQKRVEVIVELEDWDPKQSYTRTGLDEAMIDLLGVKVQHLKLPIFPGKNVTIIAEVIALNYLLKHYNQDASKILSGRIEDAIKKKIGRERMVNWFEQDFE